MGKTLLERKFLELEQEEKRINDYFDVTKRHKKQHPWIDDMREDFKADLQNFGRQQLTSLPPVQHRRLEEAHLDHGPRRGQKRQGQDFLVDRGRHPRASPPHERAGQALDGPQQQEQTDEPDHQRDRPVQPEHHVQNQRPRSPGPNSLRAAALRTRQDQQAPDQERAEVLAADRQVHHE